MLSRRIERRTPLLTLWSLVVWYLINASYSLLATCPNEREALELLYSKTNGKSWLSKVNWKSESDHCKWTGISCNEKNEVIGIDLDSMGVVFNPNDMAYMGCFDKLELLNLNYATISGPFPPEFCELTRLKYLYLDEVGLSGPLSDCLCSMLGLQYFSAVSNSINSILPWCMGTLPGIRSIDLAYNNLNGTINPALIQSKELEVLSLKCNKKLSCDVDDSIKPGNSFLMFTCGWSLLCIAASIRCCKK